MTGRDHPSSPDFYPVPPEERLLKPGLTASKAWQDANAVEYCLREARRHLEKAREYAEHLDPHQEFTQALGAALLPLPYAQREAIKLRSALRDKFYRGQ